MREDVEFHLYADCGNPAKIFVDGECLASKGVGRIRITPGGPEGNLTDVSMDVFVTHTVAAPPDGHGYNNVYYRVKQVTQLVNEFLKASTADVIVLGGDFNTPPDLAKGLNRRFLLVNYLLNAGFFVAFLLHS